MTDPLDNLPPGQRRVALTIRVMTRELGRGISGVELQRRLRIAKSATMQHVKKLRHAGIITNQRYQKYSIRLVDPARAVADAQRAAWLAELLRPAVTCDGVRGDLGDYAATYAEFVDWCRRYGIDLRSTMALLMRRVMDQPATARRMATRIERRKDNHVDDHEPPDLHAPAGLPADVPAVHAAAGAAG